MKLTDATDQELVSELAKRNDYPIIAMLYLELSNIVIAKTKREIELEKQISELTKDAQGTG
ncbi:hypothetical protein LCGC14_0756770 [marine sediment metagenome]|uniref:Uncharacterized protein n=1 Tax=marine sediment metagenome TaxID=412755 RepID=A0A0F9SMM6_9ZZZZ